MQYSITRLSQKHLTREFFATLKYLSPSTVWNAQKAKKQFSRIKKDKNHRTFVAIDSTTREVIGMTTLLIEQKFSHNFGQLGHIEDVVVRPGFERFGIGSALVQRAQAEAKNEKCYRLLLDCSNENIKFYKKLGFHKRGNEMINNI